MAFLWTGTLWVLWVLALVVRKILLVFWAFPVGGWFAIFWSWIPWVAISLLASLFFGQVTGWAIFVATGKFPFGVTYAIGVSRELARQWPWAGRQSERL